MRESDPRHKFLMRDHERAVIFGFLHSSEDFFIHDIVIWRRQTLEKS